MGVLVRTSAAGSLSLLVNEEQDEGQAEDAHDAGARGQHGGRDICNRRAEMSLPFHLPFPGLPQAKITELSGMEETLKIIQSGTEQPRVASELMQCGPHTQYSHWGALPAVEISSEPQPRSFIAAAHPKVFGLLGMRREALIKAPSNFGALIDPLPASKCSGIRGLVTHSLC